MGLKRAAALWLCFFTLVLCDDSIVQLPGGGSLQGALFEGYRSFLGVPFALPPVGALRWTEPVPVGNWTGTKQAVAFGPGCDDNEDCLYLNVWTPRGSDASEKLPVMVWFYGGCWEQGTSADPLYDGAHLVRHSQKVVVVSTNYRLGPLGYLASASLAAESPTGTTGNYGLLDQRLALQWVQANIGVFGGDKTRVTIFGQSAGSGSVADHLIMPNSFGLYQAAIMESGPFADWVARPMDVAQAQFDTTVAKVGCDSPGQTDAQVVDCLRNLSFTAVKNSYIDCDTTCCYYPTIDGVEITDKPEILASLGRFNHVPMMLGTTMNEGSMFMTLPYNLTEAEYEASVLTKYGPTYGPQVLALYPVSAYKSPWWAACAIWTHTSFTCPARRSVRWIAGNGGTVFQYYWTHVIEETVLFDPYLGAFHGVELFFVFRVPPGKYHGYPIAFTPLEMLLQERIGEHWVQFATTGNPNLSGSEWPLFDLTSQKNIVLNDRFELSSFLFKADCDLWDVVQNFTKPVV